MEVLYAVQETANLYSDKQFISLSVLKDVNSVGQLLADMELLVKCILNEFSFWNVLGLQIILYALQCQSVSPLLSAPENLNADEEMLLSLSSNYADPVDEEKDGEESEGDEEDEEEEEGEEEDEGEPDSDDDEKGNVEDNEEDEEADEGGDPAEDEDDEGEGEEDEEDNGEAGAEEEEDDDDDDDDEDEVPADEDEDEDDEDEEEEEAPKPKKIKR